MSPRATAKRGNETKKRTRRSKWFTERQLDQLEQQMQAEYARIMRVARDVSDEMFGDVELSEGSGDAGDISSDREMRQANSYTLGRSLDETRDLVNALHRLRTAPEDFGLCTSCEEPIAIERLEIVPTTRYCARHAN